MNIAHYAKTRYTTKAFDPGFKLSPDQVEQIEALLRHSPSSTNSQPWHFFIAGSDEGKARVAKATANGYSFNQAKVLNASHVVVFCTRAALDDAHLQTLLEQEDRDGRFASAEARAGQHKGRSHFADMHRFELRDASHWMEKQVYLAVGTLLLGAAALEIDACPIEGFDQRIMGEELGLREKGLVASVIVALGRRSDEDFNAKLPKSRLPADAVITRL
ncbi:oxygen-insensitive NAD(P)H nitroreductase [Chromobacterium piscinae]|uniref:Oxygen-insensitive NAD(P)H nitroreductase n=1 Tax=Chromobacterium piscinae TaxID=686831 RepID=A0ABV0H3C9_9NEIS|nr:oxygen-insensitive NAD(P)H nitroreductase [Chromobacterium piscinae]MCD4504144.1 oxygen-insensitive NAD(P)H nitroreductase [Chromobacterium piscinae]MCD5327562.1 oxygen-insensitive NAD(P)H nitroreductase [Chromobacterium piscinae]NHQ83237.1 oxygen-insensitive NAD(P)H nitroreductase [Chromobacterium vaccinii]